MRIFTAAPRQLHISRRIVGNCLCATIGVQCPYAPVQHRNGDPPMSPRRLTNRAAVLRIACAVFAAIFTGMPGAEVLSLTSADGSVIETNKPMTSNRFVGADAIWLHDSYPMSIDCRPPRGCYAKSQLI